MAKWTARGSVRLDGVVFTITADTEAEARAKAVVGDFDEYDEMGAGSADWEIIPSTVELDE
jgi:hypothetical protein